MNAPPFPLNPSVGQIAGNYVWNGSMWVCMNQTVGMQVSITTFTTSGVYMPAAGLTSLVVECIGGGGGGGGVAQPTSNEVFSGSGGGSGGYSRKALPASLVLGGVVVTIGAGGVNGGNQGQAGAGGATTFGALCVANGGLGGFAMYPSVTAPEPGAGAAPGIGDVALPGSAGDPGTWLVLSAPSNTTLGSPNGGVMWGGDQGVMVGAATATQGLNGRPNTGAGGGGGIINQYATATSVAGGAGGTGVCIVTEYVWGGQSGGCAPDCGPIPITDNSCIGWGPGPWR